MSGDTQDEVLAEQPEQVVPPEIPHVQFYVLDEAGETVRSGECKEDLVQLQAFLPGETVHRGEAPKAEHEEATFTHTVVRAVEYPTLEEQIGAIWKILARNPDALGEEGREMLGRIQSVKDRIPKDKVYVQNTSDENGARYIPVEN